MFYAIDERGLRIDAAPGRRGFCPLCRVALTPRCGDVHGWHWAHSTCDDCDRWWEPETEWHRSWKVHAASDQVEVPLGAHRADIIGNHGVVVELQNTFISAAEIRERERFYDRMVWLINGEEFASNFRVEVGSAQPVFHWAHARHTWLTAKKPIFIHWFSLGRAVMTPFEKIGRTYPRWHELDRSNKIFQIRSLSCRPYVHGTGRIIPVDHFIKTLIAPPEGSL